MLDAGREASASWSQRPGQGDLETALRPDSNPRSVVSAEQKKLVSPKFHYQKNKEEYLQKKRMQRRKFGKAAWKKLPSAEYKLKVKQEAAKQRAAKQDKQAMRPVTVSVRTPLSFKALGLKQRSL